MKFLLDNLEKRDFYLKRIFLHLDFTLVVLNVIIKINLLNNLAVVLLT